MSDLHVVARAVNVDRKHEACGSLEVTLSDVPAVSLAHALIDWTYKRALFLMLKEDIFDWIESDPGVRGELMEQLNDD